MKPGITFENIWHDEDMYEFRIPSSDGVSLFSHEVYVGYGTFDETIVALDNFIISLKSLNNGNTDIARLEIV